MAIEIAPPNNLAEPVALSFTVSNEQVVEMEDETKGKIIVESLR
jgi:hypothetical protein